MQHSLDDIGGARELALHRINVAKDDLEDITELQTIGHIMLFFGQSQHVLHWSLRRINNTLR